MLCCYGMASGTLFPLPSIALWSSGLRGLGRPIAAGAISPPKANSAARLQHSCHRRRPTSSRLPFQTMKRRPTVHFHRPTMKMYRWTSFQTMKRYLGYHFFYLGSRGELEAWICKGSRDGGVCSLALLPERRQVSGSVSPCLHARCFP